MYVSYFVVKIYLINYQDVIRTGNKMIIEMIL